MPADAAPTDGARGDEESTNDERAEKPTEGPADDAPTDDAPTDDASGDGAVAVELYVRSLAPRGTEGAQSAVVETLTDLSDRGAIADHDVRVWGDAVPTGSDHELARRVDEFERWASTADATLVGVEERPVGSLVDDLRSVRTVPTLALAEYRDGELVSVAPRESDGTLLTVADRLGALAAADDGPGSRPQSASD